MVSTTVRRTVSLDILRGLTVAAMILVNNPGDWSAVFPPLLHAYWTGITFADLIFPSFIFIMGAAMPFAFARRREAGHSRGQIYRRVGRRVVGLIILGLVLNVVAAWPDAFPLRFPGVLQRIAVVYLAASVVLLNLAVSRWLVVAAGLLLGHWALLALVPFDGYPAGTLLPDRNLARFLDSAVFGRHALTIPIDPEGLLGTAPATATALLGASIGEVIRRTHNTTTCLQAIVVRGTVALGAGAMWSLALPMSKPLWTASFVLVTAGLATLCLAGIYWIVDVVGAQRGTRPFVWLGMNPLAIYVGSEVIGHLLDGPWLPQDVGRTSPKAWLMWGVLEPAFRPWAAEWASLAFAASFVAFWIAAAGALSMIRRVPTREPGMS